MTRPVRTLLLCSRPPWPRRGGDRVRTFHLARALASIGEVDVVALRGADEDEAAIRAGLPFVRRWWLPVLRRPAAAVRTAGALLDARALQQAVYDAPEARAAVAEALDGGAIDVIVAHLVRTVPWVPADSPPLVVDVQDALSAQYEASRGRGRGWRGLAYSVERGRIGQAEAAAVTRADVVSFIADRDREQVVNGDPVRAVIARAVIDLDRFGADVEPEPGVIGFLGNLRSASNRDMAVHMARRVLPLVRSARPEATLRVMGVEAGPAVRGLGRLPGVTYVGPVEDAAAELARCALTVCPLRFGSGVQNKVLESLAAGTPAVVTPEAAAGLGPRAGDAIAVARLDRPFADEVVGLLADPAERARRAALGRRFVEAVHAPEVATADLLATVRELAAGGTTRSGTGPRAKPAPAANASAGVSVSQTNRNRR